MYFVDGKVFIDEPIGNAIGFAGAVSIMEALSMSSLESLFLSANISGAFVYYLISKYSSHYCLIKRNYIGGEAAVQVGEAVGRALMTEACRIHEFTLQGSKHCISNSEVLIYTEILL